MKKTQLTELFQLIRRSFVPFLSVVLFIAMSITLYAGLTWTGRSLENRIDAAFDQTNSYDLSVASSLGLTDSDIDDIRQLDGVSDVEPYYLSYQTISGESAGSIDREVYCSVRSITERIDTLEVVDGALPSKPGEIALLQNCTQLYDYKVGDTITFEADGEDASVNEGMKYLKGKTFTITALVSSSDYLCVSQASLGVNSDGKQVTCVFFADKSAFSADAYGNSYPAAYLTGTGMKDLNSFDNDYWAASAKLLATVEQTGTTLAQSRYSSVKGDAEKQIADGQSQLDDAKAKIDDARAQISDGQQQLDSKKSELASAQSQLDSETASAYSKKAEAEAQLAQAESALAESRNQLAQLQQTYSEAESQVNYYSSMADSLKALSDDTQERFQAVKTEAETRMYQPGFSTWLQEQCDILNADTNAKVAAFKQAYPTRPDELEPLLDGLQVSATDKATDEQAAKNAVGLGVAADRIISEGVAPGQAQLSELKSGIDQLSAGIDEGQAQLDAAREEYSNTWAQAESQISYGESQIASGKSQIASGENQLESGQAQLAEKESQYASGQESLNKAKATASKVHPSDWVISDRDDSYVYQLSNTTAQTLGSLRLTMALLFMIVGLLVCYSVMSRLVHEHIVQLGTKKALGFTTFEISKLFLNYALLACIIGMFLGTLIGAPIVQAVLLPSINRYVFDPPGIIIQLLDTIEIGVAQLVLICLSAWLACRSILKKNAIELLGGERPSTAKRRFYEGWKCWKRMGMLTQTMVNNCFNDKRRMFGTFVGVAGCTALIVCAMTLQGGIWQTTNTQETVIERYDQVVSLLGSSSKTQAQDSSQAQAKGSGQTQDQGSSQTQAQTASDSSHTVDGVISEMGFPAIKAKYGMKAIDLPDGSKTISTLIVPESMSDLPRVMTIQLTQGSTSDDGTLSEDGAYISNALATYYHYKVGDNLTLDGPDGNACSISISGIFNYYGGTHVIIMSGSAYKACFGVDAKYTARLVAPGNETSSFLDAVKGATDFEGIFDSREVTREISQTVNKLALTVVAIYIGISALVALFVLLNLNIMFITEKRRELVVMMVNGYEHKDAKRYVSRDTIIMDALGMVAGCLLGTGMGILAIDSLQNNRLSFIANVSPLAWLIGVVVCGAFSFIVMRIALRRVDKFKLTSLNE